MRLLRPEEVITPVRGGPNHHSITRPRKLTRSGDQVTGGQSGAVRVEYAGRSVAKPQQRADRPKQVRTEVRITAFDQAHPGRQVLKEEPLASRRAEGNVGAISGRCR